MKTIFWHELKINRKSLLLWLVGMAMLAGMGSGEYSVVVGSGYRYQNSVYLYQRLVEKNALLLMNAYEKHKQQHMQ